MKKIFGIACMLVLCQCYAPAQHVILVSIDGLRPEFYKDPTWGMVNIRQAMGQGSYSDGVRGVFPTVTYPSHTTIISGVKPLKHGIYYNTPSEPLGITGKWYWEYDSLKVPTLWTEARKAGLKTAAVSWPVTVKAPIDYNIPEYWVVAKEKGEKNDYVRGMEQESQPKGLFEEVQLNATGKLSKQGFDLDYYSGDANLSRMAAYIFMKYKPSLLALHIATVDHFEHEQGREGDKVRIAVADADRAVKNLIDAVEKAGLKDSTTFIITGDHGFVDIHTQLSPNVLLAKAGLIDPDAKKWKAYFHSSGASSFLHVSDKKDQQTLAKVREVLKAIPEKEKKLFRIVERAELDLVGSDPSAILALAPIEGVTFSSSAKGTFVNAAKGGTHGYFPDFKHIETGFVTFGRNIRKGVVIPAMGLEDISPLIATLLGFPFPAADGVLYPGLLK